MVIYLVFQKLFRIKKNFIRALDNSLGFTKIHKCPWGKLTSLATMQNQDSPCFFTVYGSFKRINSKFRVLRWKKNGRRHWNGLPANTGHSCGWTGVSRQKAALRTSKRIWSSDGICIVEKQMSPPRVSCWRLDITSINCTIRFKQEGQASIYFPWNKRPDFNSPKLDLEGELF